MGTFDSSRFRRVQLEARDVPVQRRLAGPGSKVCKGCDDDVELRLFPVDVLTPGGRHHLCFACRAEANRKVHPTG